MDFQIFFTEWFPPCLALHHQAPGCQNQELMPKDGDDQHEQEHHHSARYFGAFQDGGRTVNLGRFLSSQAAHRWIAVELRNRYLASWWVLHVK